MRGGERGGKEMEDFQCLSMLPVLVCNEIYGWQKRREGKGGERERGRGEGESRGHLGGMRGVKLYCAPSQLKELRAVARHEAVDHQHFLSLLRGLEQPMLLSVRATPLLISDD